MAAYLERGCQFVIVARKTAPLLALLREAEWKLSPKTDADAQCEFTYQPDGWEKAFRFVALRYEQPPKPADEVEQYQLFATGQYTYRVFVTDMPEPIHLVVAFYNGRAGAENLIKQDEVATLRHTTLATARLRFLFVAAKIWGHAGRTGVSYSDHYAEKGLFERLMDRLRGITPRGLSFAPVLVGVLT